MKIKSQSYPDKIRRIAEDLRRMRVSPKVDSSADRLRKIADELERNLREAVRKQP